MKQNEWSSRLMFILAATGAAVGLGNIWKFPYMAGDYGGSAFVLLYVICVLLIGIPAMIAEILLGKIGKKNPIDTLLTLAKQTGHSPHWQWIGWLGAVSLLMVLSFYSAISGWSIAYIGYAVSGVFENSTPELVYNQWAALMSDPLLLVELHTLFMILTLWVVARGVKNGLEWASKWMMPLLFLTVSLLMVYGIWQGDFKAGWHFLFHFDLTRIDAEGVLAAMGHAFFTLAIGAGAMLVYGAYLPKSVSLFQTITAIALLDVLIAFMAGLAIFPLVFANHLTAEAGPGLMFKVLPIALLNMPFGRFIGTLFFILLLFASWTSSISMAEPLVLILMERFKFSRKKAAWMVGIIAWTLGLAAVFSFNIWRDVQILGRYGIFQVLTDIPTNLLLPLGGLGFTVFTLWVLPIKMTKTALAAPPYLERPWRFITRYVTPIGILVILIAGFW